MTMPMRTMTRAEREAVYEYNRRRYLPSQLEAARRKVEALENEAKRYGMTELLTHIEHYDRAWDRAVAHAQNEAAAKGGSIGFGE